MKAIEKPTAHTEIKKRLQTSTNGKYGSYKQRIDLKNIQNDQNHGKQKSDLRSKLFYWKIHRLLWQFKSLNQGIRPYSQQTVLPLSKTSKSKINRQKNRNKKPILVNEEGD